MCEREAAEEEAEEAEARDGIQTKKQEPPECCGEQESMGHLIKLA